MEDNAIPEEYFSCHADKLFDLLASSLLDFAKRHGRYCFTCRAECITNGVYTCHTAVAQQALDAWTRLDAPSGKQQSLWAEHTAWLDSGASLLRQGRWVCRHSEDRQLPIGFCFSFPCTHTAIGEAIMVKLTKKFENEGLVGEDPAKGLQRALDRQKANVRSPHSPPQCAPRFVHAC